MAHEHMPGYVNTTAVAQAIAAINGVVAEDDQIAAWLGMREVMNYAEECMHEVEARLGEAVVDELLQE